MSNKVSEQRLIGKMTTKLNERVFKPLILAVFLTVTITSFSSRFSLLPPVSKHQCIPGLLFIMDKYDKNISQGDLVTFKAKGTMLFPDGTLFTKITAGVGNDLVEVKRHLVTNGLTTYTSDISVTADYLKISLDTLSRTTHIPEGKLYALGTLPGSYDSRFWGTVDVQKQVVGKTYVIF